MREQWRKFLDDNSSCWNYGIVPNLVERLDSAINAVGDCEVNELIMDLIDSLYLQGVMVNEEGDLCFVADYIYLFPADWDDDNAET